MKLQIYHTVNAGIYLWNGKSGLLIDALHRGGRMGFSDTSGRYIRMMQQREQFFGQVNDLLFTHLHADHYDEELVDQFFALNLGSLIYGPGLDRGKAQSVLLERDVRRIQIRDYIIYAFETVHDGKAYAEEPHCSYLIHSGNQSLWVSGDAVLNGALADKVKHVFPDGRICAAFVMVYQIGSRGGREFLRKLSPDNICLYHLPYREDDIFHYYSMAEDVEADCRKEGIVIRRLCPDSFIEYTAGDEYEREELF